MSANNASELLFDVVDPLSIPEEAFEGLFDRARVIAYPYADPWATLALSERGSMHSMSWGHMAFRVNFQR